MSLLEVPTGFIADKCGRKRSVLIGLVALMFFLCFYLSVNNFYLLVVAGLFFAIATTLISGDDKALIYNYLKDKDLEDIYLEFSSKMNSISYILKSIVLIASIYLLDLNVMYSVILSVGFIIIAIVSINNFKPDIGLKEKKVKKVEKMIGKKNKNISY